MTLLEKAKEMGLRTMADNFGGWAGGCPSDYGLTSAREDKDYCYCHTCSECYARPYEGRLESNLNAPKTAESEAKADAGKLEIDLVPMQIVEDIAEVRMYGTKKYGDPDNWKKVELRRYVNALLRHLLAFLRDHKSVDSESGIPHYKHMACNLAFICEMLRGTP